MYCLVNVIQSMETNKMKHKYRYLFATCKQYDIRLASVKEGYHNFEGDSKLIKKLYHRSDCQHSDNKVIRVIT